ncbi:hypothetical protein WICPIJ_003959 [Wickerhamomyces pijperi]|uniref:Uncharacterized protein n=1 Tax=Wickerhamomyces pijperi TaxID=599730 RepID=A0A9P8Q674_WICPI|nr:hypothetical protein WICPIJ_003959 [Wickerhamomyces pijperi]
MLITPFGTPTSAANSANKAQVPGHISDGLMTVVLPVAMMNGIVHNGIMTGKLKGMMEPIIPIGSLTTLDSTPLEISKETPSVSLTMTVAYSAHWIPLYTSAIAADSGIDGSIHFSVGGLRNTSDNVVGGWVKDIEPFLGVGLEMLVVDVSGGVVLLEIFTGVLGWNIGERRWHGRKRSGNGSQVKLVHSGGGSGKHCVCV